MINYITSANFKRDKSGNWFEKSSLTKMMLIKEVIMQILFDKKQNWITCYINHTDVLFTVPSLFQNFLE